MHTVQKNTDGKYLVVFTTDSNKFYTLFECPSFYIAMRLAAALNGSIERMQSDDFDALIKDCTEVM